MLIDRYVKKEEKEKNKNSNSGDGEISLEGSSTP